MPVVHAPKHWCISVDVVVGLHAVPGSIDERQAATFNSPNDISRWPSSLERMRRPACLCLLHFGGNCDPMI